MPTNGQSPAAEVPSRYTTVIRELSDRIVEAQRPIRILDAIKWTPRIREAFFAADCSDLPPVDRDYYASQPLNFDPATKREELHDIERDITRLLGQFSPVGQIMRRVCGEYETVVRLLEARGTPEFSDLSQDLYGCASDAFHAGDPSLADLGTMLSESLSNIDASTLIVPEEKTISGERAVEILRDRLETTFADHDFSVNVVLSDGIVADAAAGSDYIKIRKDALFDERAIRLLEIHEGHVHLGTTLNGQQQPFCTFLSKGPPSSTVTQEGLAILMEILGLASQPARIRRLTNRIRAIHMAEEGANFLDVFRFFRDQGMHENEGYANAARVFRGSTPTGGPFTKDLSYSKGFVLVYNYVMLAVRKGLLDRIPLLFCGKTNLADMRTIAQLVEEGLVVPPRYLPPPLEDLRSLSAWMCYSSFLSRLDLRRIEADYANLF